MSGTLDNMALIEENTELCEQLRELHVRDLEMHKKAIQDLHKQKMDKVWSITRRISGVLIKMLGITLAIVVIGFVGAAINNTFLTARFQHELRTCSDSCEHQSYASSHINFRLSDNSDCYCYNDGVHILHETIPR